MLGCRSYSSILWRTGCKSLVHCPCWAVNHLLLPLAALAAVELTSGADLQSSGFAHTVCGITSQWFPQEPSKTRRRRLSFLSLDTAGFIPVTGSIWLFDWSAWHENIEVRVTSVRGVAGIGWVNGITFRTAMASCFHQSGQLLPGCTWVETSFIHLKPGLGFNFNSALKTHL